MGATNMEKLRLLMWKNFLQQWRHKLQTVAEILLPVVTASVIVILRTEINPTAHSSIIFPPIPAYSLQYSTCVLAAMFAGGSKLSVAYSPRSPILDRTVRAAVDRILDKNVELIDSYKGIIEFPDCLKNITTSDIPPILQKIIFNQKKYFSKKYPNYSSLVKKELKESLADLISVTPYNRTKLLDGLFLEPDAERSVIAAVTFDDNLQDATELPNDIRYELRFPLQQRQRKFYYHGGYAWRTTRVFPIYPTPGPRFPDKPEGGDDPGYMNEMFIPLQHAISMELILAKINKSLDLDINIRRFPHPPYTVDMLIEVLQILFPMLVVMSFTYTAVSTVRFVAREKELQLKESLKIMGLPTWLHWTAWFLKQFLFLLVTIFLVVLVLKVNWYPSKEGVPDYAVFTLTPWSVIFMFMTLYIICTIFFCFMVSGLFGKASTATLICAVFWFLAYVPALFLTTDNNASFAGKMLSCFSVNSAMALGFQVILKAEAAHEGMQWGEFLATTSTDDDFRFGHVIIMLVLDCWLYMAVALYVEKVLPGSFGIAQPWYFVFLPSYWLPNKYSAKVKYCSETGENTEAIQECDPTGLKVGVEIQNLTKVFNKHAAVNNLSLSIFKDQITVLLGHNGAGKTTTISMLTGMISPSRGTAIMAGHNILTNMNEARSSLGICPQHNVLFTDMTVREHLEFFSRIKGLRGDKLIKDVEDLIIKLELETKANTRAGALSGGQQRRLCVGVALCGSPRVVILDEPTSGMDPSSRRALWDLLQREKKDRAMILTTHFMDEADILGDRIAIMSGGQLQCVGSPFFLKQKYGTGYKLIIVKEAHCDVEACTALLKKHLSDVKMLSNRGSELVYALPTSCSLSFQNKLEDLETNQYALGVRSYGLIPTTLEDVFMKVGADSEKPGRDNVDDAVIANEQNNIGSSHESGLSTIGLENGTTEYVHLSHARVRGIRLLGNHVAAVWMKRTLVTMRDWRLSLLQILIPIVIVVLSILTFDLTSVLGSTAFPRELKLIQGYKKTETLLGYDHSMNDTFSYLAMRAFRNDFQNLDLTLVETGNISVENFYLNKGAQLSNMVHMRSQNVIGATFERDSATAWFSNFGYHDVAVSLAAMHNALLQAHEPSASIRVTNFPLPSSGDNQMQNTLLAMQLSTCVSTSMAIVTSFFVMFYIKERVSRAKLLQHSSGIQPVVFWSVAAVFDWTWFMVVCLGVTLTLTALNVEGFTSLHEQGRGYLVFMVYGASMLPFHYLASFLFSGTAAGFVFTYFIQTFLGPVCSAIIDVLKIKGYSNDMITLVIDSILQYFPTYSLSNCFRRLNKSGLTESSCIAWCNAMVNSRVGTTVHNFVSSLDNVCNMKTACDKISFCCVDDDETDITRYINCMLVTGIVLWIILVIIEYRVFDMLACWRQKRTPLLNMSLEDEDVVKETEQVYKINDINLNSYNLICRNVSRFYGDHLAVNQVSFSVKSKECFGLLGINGAGKSTTFKMLTGDIPITSGDAYVRGYSVKNNIKRVHENIGYCPQFDALFEELTGRETLRLYALLRGLHAKYAAALTLDLARRLKFLQHIDKRVGQYSGGNKRKLSTAIALMGYASIMYLDEPTTGVDPAAKRQVWRAIHNSTKTGRSVVLTSHSMEECEALCTRLAIMVNGRFQCLGSTQHLKDKFSQGYILTAKLKPVEENAIPTNTIEAVKNFITEHFENAKLMESYQGLMTFYIPPDPNTVWSHMFGLMENAKGHLVEDYIISQTTLEQVFLQFAKYQKDALSVGSEECNLTTSEPSSIRLLEFPLTEIETEPLIRAEEIIPIDEGLTEL